jgi:DNA (cytosine-5)-methyltransferase 1
MRINATAPTTSTMTIKKYELHKSAIEKLQPTPAGQLRDELQWSPRGSSVSIGLKSRGYRVNGQSVDLDASKVHAIGFFSGAGGLDIGTQLAGARVISSLDFDADSVQTLKSNRFLSHAEHLCDDIRNVTAKHYKQLIKANNPEKLILVGGPPCQPFSKAGYWVTHKNRLGSDDPRNMIGQYLRLIEELKPNGFILENVESLLHPKNIDAVVALEEAVATLGFNLLKYRADAIDFGVPQKRKRVFFIATKKKLRGEPKKTHGPQTKSQIDIFERSDLLPYERVVDWIAKFDNEKYYEPYESTTGKTYDVELKEVPPGQNYFALTDRNGYPNPKFEANKRFWNFLLKLHPLQPSWTISAQPGPWVGPFHWNNRRLRVPEIAAIQTFPEDYIFAGSRRSVQKQIGNAVPVLLGKAMIEYLLESI